MDKLTWRSFLVVVWGLILAGQSLPILAVQSQSNIPAWTTERYFDPDVVPENALNGVQTLFSDIQFGLINGEHQTFYRVAIRAKSQSAVQRISYFRTNYIEDYQSVQHHYVYVWRDGEKIDATNQLVTKRNVLQSGGFSESDETTVQEVSFIPGVRRGDVVEFATSIRGTNPAFSGTMAGSFLSFDAAQKGPITRSVVVPKELPIHFDLRGGHVAPSVTTVDGYTHYNWVIPAENEFEYKYEPFAPQWFSQVPYILYSSHGTWSEVSAWAENVFLREFPELDLSETAHKIAGGSGSDLEKVKAVLGYMQSEIRYVGLELGRNGYIPFDPAVVLDRKFGDCKDQTILMYYLLKELGLDAIPALVNTKGPKWANERFPSPLSFNHIILMVEIDDKQYWLDPTMHTESSSLVSLKNPRFGKALLVRNGESELLDIPADVPADGGYHVQAEDFFGMPALFGAAGQVGMTRRYYGFRAHKYRQKLWDGGEEAIVEFFTEQLKKKTDEVDGRGQPEIIDDPANNEFHFIGDFRVSRIGKKIDDRFEVKIAGDEIRNSLVDFKLGETPRKSPALLVFPMKIRQEQTIFVPDHFDLQLENYELDSKYHRFTAMRQKISNGVNITYEYETFTDSVPVEDIEAYLDDVKKIKEETEWFLWFKPDKPDFKIDIEPVKPKIELPAIEVPGGDYRN